MHLYCLSGNPRCPCLVIRFKTVTIMLDCALDMTSMLHFLPLPVVNSGKFVRAADWSAKDNPITANLGALRLMDLSEVDVIVLSNFYCLMALPYITEYSGFHGKIYTTDPTLCIGRNFAEELMEYIDRSPRLERATKWKQPKVLNYLPGSIREAVNCNQWRQFFQKDDLEKALSKDVFGALKLSAVSSGYCIGSSAWVIQSDYEKIVYLSGASTLTTHPKPMNQDPLRDSDVFILSGLTYAPTVNPDVMIGEFVMNAALTLKNGGNVLVPCSPCGIIFDLFECLCQHLDDSGLMTVPMFFISPVAKSCLAHSSIYSEWLSAGKQNRVFVSEELFHHTSMLKTGRLKQFKTIHGEFSSAYRTPCVVFTGHPSLRVGDVVHFIQLWGDSSANTIIFTEPDYNYIEALLPYQPLAMKVVHCPIDTSVNFSQANKLIRELAPRHLVCSEQYTSAPLAHPLRADLTINTQEISCSTFRRGDVIQLPVKRSCERVEIDPQMAVNLVPSELRPGVAVASISGALCTNDHRYQLTSCEKGGLTPRFDGDKMQAPSYLCGNLDVFTFVEKLAKQGITDVKVEPEGEGHMISVQNSDTSIHISPSGSHIRCDNESLRLEIKNTLVRCLESF